MSSLTIRNVDEELKQRLRLQAVRHGCSMEQEVRNILQVALEARPASDEFANRINRRFQGLEAEQLPIPARQIARQIVLPS